ncbi:MULTISPECIES: PH domain-containing protein [Niastella]|uniref:PH domain-containing protein n=1 Tax=Niastella soli TaxID=2821487 RepID=A0ABS3Z5C0_9BACT|nr:PH domain-containing protein [Niastella soli]MBO9205373.1 PH domain-containing protein [Niastella soli]
MRTPLQKGEQILLVTHTSWVKLILPVLIALAGWVGSFLIGFLNWGWIAAVVGSLYYLIVYFSWKVNIWVVTNFRVIDEAGLLNHFAKESPLEKINNVSYDQTIWGRLLNFGHVEIQTAAEVGATDYYNVHGPKRLKDTITLAQAEYKNIQLANQAQHMATAMGIQTGEVKYSSSAAGGGIASELEKLHQLKQQGIISEEEYIKAKNKLLG